MKENCYLVRKVKDGWFKSHYEIVKLEGDGSVMSWDVDSKRIALRENFILSIKDGDIEYL